VTHRAELILGARLEQLRGCRTLLAGVDHHAAKGSAFAALRRAAGHCGSMGDGRMT
jgi:hypothetical protein